MKSKFSKFLTLFFCLVMGVNVWGETVTFSASDIAKTSESTTKDGITMTCNGTQSTSNRNFYMDGTTTKKTSASGLSSSADGSPSTKYIEIKGDGITSLDINMANNSTGNGECTVVFFDGDYDDATKKYASYVLATVPGYDTRTSADAPLTNVSVPDGTETIRIYRRVKVDATNKVLGTGTTVPSNAITCNIASIVVNYTAGAVTKHTVTFAAGEGTGDMAAVQVAEGKEYTIPNCTFTAPAGKIFAAWTSSDVTITDGKFTMPTTDVTVTATWEKPLGEIVKVTADGGSNKTINTNIIGATVDINLSSSKKVDGGKYFGIIGSFKAGDVVNVNITDVSGGKMMIFNAKQADAEHLIYSLDNKGSIGDNIFTLENDVDAIWVYRDGTFCGWNPNINFISVTRHGDIASQVYAGKANVNEVEQTVAAVENVITLENSYANVPTVALVTNITYEDGTNGNGEVAVEFAAELVEGYFVGTATIGTTEYTVKAAKDTRTFYTVTYFDYDGETEISSESVVENGHVANIPDYKRDHYTLDKWVKLDNSDVDLNAEITADLDVKAKVNKVFSQSFDIERWIMDNGKNDPKFKAELAVKGIVYKNIDAVDSLDHADGKNINNYEFLGLKLKSNTAVISLMVPANKYVVLSIGKLNGLRVQFNDEDKTIKNGNQDTIFAAAATDRTFTILSTSGSTSVIKAIQLVDNNATKETLTISDAKYATYFNSERAVEVPAGVTVKNAYYDDQYHFVDLSIARKDADNLNTNIIPAGVAVVLQAETAGQIDLTYTVGGKTPALTNLYGSDEAADAAEISGKSEDKDDYYFYGLSRNAAGEASSIGFYWMVADGMSFNAAAHKAFLVLPKSAFAGKAPARIVFGGQVATDIESISAETAAQKVMINGQVFILRGEKLYTTQGQLVK